MHTLIAEIHNNYQRRKNIHIENFENYANYLINMHGLGPKSNQVMTVVTPIYILSFIKIRQMVLPQMR